MNRLPAMPFRQCVIGAPAPRTTRAPKTAYAIVLVVATAVLTLGMLNTVQAQTGVIRKASQGDVAKHSHACVDDIVLEEFYEADNKNDSAHKQALVDDELCFLVSGMKYSLIRDNGRQYSKLPGGTSDVRVYTDGHQKLADYGTSIELVVSNKYLRDFTVYAQTGVVHKSSSGDAAFHRYACVDYIALEEFYEADYRNDSAHKQALVEGELCFSVSGMKYSLIRDDGRQYSQISDGTSEVRIHNDGHQKLADYGASIKLVVSNKYLRDFKADRQKRYAGYTIIDGLIPFKIWKRDDSGRSKITFVVAIPVIDERLPTEQEIGAISRYLVSKEEKHDRYFMEFYLPEMEVGAGAFATAHHNPTMKVDILPFVWLYSEYKKYLQ